MKAPAPNPGAEAYAPRYHPDCHKKTASQLPFNAGQRFVPHKAAQKWLPKAHSKRASTIPFFAVRRCQRLVFSSPDSIFILYHIFFACQHGFSFLQQDNRTRCGIQPDIMLYIWQRQGFMQQFHIIFCFWKFWFSLCAIRAIKCFTVSILLRSIRG